MQLEYSRSVVGAPLQTRRVFNSSPEIKVVETGVLKIYLLSDYHYLLRKTQMGSFYINNMTFSVLLKKTTLFHRYAFTYHIIKSYYQYMLFYCKSSKTNLYNDYV